ncbi:MAG: hydroxymethylpyrimidine/phosphomethylpyrimidine kinase [Methylococcaceae bacterium]|nr:hydroxymethylpyrimidine/phosphomethylpyrimidine kinase [Methylococcaceae bacterium]
MRQSASHQPPVVLCFSGHDPSGGAGVQADIETLSYVGCHACTVITALTVQDTCNVRAVVPQTAERLMEQAEAVMNDLPVAAVKIGLLGAADVAVVVAALIRRLPAIPVILDPVLAAGGGAALASEELIRRIRGDLLPLTTVLTPNSTEARRLTGESGVDQCARRLLEFGCRHVLITGTHEDDGSLVTNRLYGHDRRTSWQWPRLPHSYHGSGCTLAAALAGYLALGRDVEDAAVAAQDFTWNALVSGKALGRGQHLPTRAWSSRSLETGSTNKL